MNTLALVGTFVGAALVATILLGVMEAARWIERMLMVALAEEEPE